MDGKLFYFISSLLRKHAGVDETNSALISLWKTPQAFAFSKILASAALSVKATPIVTASTITDSSPRQTSAPPPAPTVVRTSIPVSGVILDGPKPAPNPQPIKSVPSSVQVPLPPAPTVVRASIPVSGGPILQQPTKSVQVPTSSPVSKESSTAAAEPTAKQQQAKKKLTIIRPHQQPK